MTPMTPITSINAFSEPLLAARHPHGGILSTRDECQLLRQCPSCMRLTEPAHSACGACGLRFFKPVRTDEQTLRGIWTGVGVGAFLLASLIATALQYI